MPQDATSSSGLTFEPGSRNILTFMITDSLYRYYLRDIELLDKDGSPYHPADAAHLEVVSEVVKRIVNLNSRVAYLVSSCLVYTYTTFSSTMTTNIIKNT